MLDLVRVGSALTFIGFLAVGSAYLAGATAALPSTLEEAQRAQEAARSWQTVQGFGWIVAGLGLGMALLGIAKGQFAIDSKSEIMIGRSRRVSGQTERHRGFVCEKCGGEVSETATICPHCGSTLEIWHS